VKEELFNLEGLLRSASRMMKADIRELLGDGMTSSEFMVIRLIEDQGALKASEVSKLMEVSASHITSVTDSLVEKGFITRQRSSEDRRVIELALTDDGKARLIHFKKKKSLYFQQLFQSFSEEEILNFMKLIEKMLTHKDKAKQDFS
jgi:DNA-binding MarR family transcriptional regulator